MSTKDVAAWFAKYKPREQVSLLVLALAVVLFIGYSTVWQPLARLRTDTAERNQGLSAVLQRVDNMVSQISALKDSGASVRPDRNIAAVINATTDSYQLQVLRMQPNSRGEVQVRFENAAFDDLSGWLHTMENQQGLVAREVAISQAGAAGRVNATIRIGQGS